MRPLGVLLSIVIVIGALTGTVWVARYSPWAGPQAPPKLPSQAQEMKRVSPLEDRSESEKEEAKQQAKADAATAKGNEKAKDDGADQEDPTPPIAAKGPYPKVLTGERTFEFGTMGVDEQRKHKFTIENKGQAPLLLARGETQCKCTLSALKDGTVPPGGKTEVELAWTPREAGTFQKHAIIKTNDPENPQVKFHIIGTVAQEYLVAPPHTWNAGFVTDVEKGHAVGEVVSQLDDDFKILSVTSTHPLVSATFTKFSKREATRADILCGYKFDVTVETGIPMGPFRSRLKIKTDLGSKDGDEKEIDVEVTADRSGPIKYLPPSDSGKWVGSRSLLLMGRFSHTEGRKVTLPALIYQLPDDLKILSMENDTPELKFKIERNESIGSKDQKGYNFVFEVPANSPTLTRIAPTPANIKLKTNHPKLPEMKFVVEFISL